MNRIQKRTKSNRRVIDIIKRSVNTQKSKDGRVLRQPEGLQFESRGDRESHQVLKQWGKIGNFL